MNGILLTKRTKILFSTSPGLKNTIYVLFLFTIFSAEAQSLIKGNVKDKNQKGIAFVNVTLQKGDSTAAIVAFAYTDKEGNYILETDLTGEFFLSIVAMGYRQKKNTHKFR